MQNMISGIVSSEEVSTHASDVEYMDDVDPSEFYDEKKEHQQVMSGGDRPKPGNIMKEVDATDESYLMTAIRLSEELKLGTFDKCYEIIKLTEGDEETAILIL